MWYDFGRCMVSVEPWAEMIVNGHAWDWPWVATPKALTKAKLMALGWSAHVRTSAFQGGHAAQEVMEPMCLAVMHDGQGNSQTIVNCCQPLGKGCLCPTSMTWGHKNTPPGNSSGPPTMVEHHISCAIGGLC